MKIINILKKNLCFTPLFITFISLNGYSQIAIPYENSFETPTDTVGWKHYALGGTDSWEWGIPNGAQLNSAYNGIKVWATNLDGYWVAYSDFFLESPAFDFSDTTNQYVLRFAHNYSTASYHGGNVEYSTDGISWHILNGSTSQKTNWYTNTACSGLNNEPTWSGSQFLYGYKISSHILDTIAGEPYVKFRFQFGGSSNPQEGWEVDHFQIIKNAPNIYALQGDTIKNINKYFTQFTVTCPFGYLNPAGASHPLQNDFYFSTDSILDAGDTFLGSVTGNYSTSIPGWQNTFTLPPNLNAGNYYVIYNLDVLDSVSEINELDNQSFAILEIDSIYATNYLSDFDSSVYDWNNAILPIASFWKKGIPNNWHMPEARSTPNSWSSGNYAGSSYQYRNMLESPYLDFSNSVNTTLCFWYKNSSEQAVSQPNFLIGLPFNSGTQITYPAFPSTNTSSNWFPIRKARYYGWDCHCLDISSLDGEISTKIKIYGHGNTEPINLSQITIDDIYIGAPKPDVAIEGEKINRFTSSNVPVDTLDYLLFNSGLSVLPTTVTNFYWSNDSILDGGDILLGTQTEPSIADTSFILRKFIYTKPTLTEGRYFIIYELDNTNLVDEMREYDNVGTFELFQNYQPLPYYNDFETQINGWRHRAMLGKDQWEWAVPAGTILDTAFSGVKAFVTQDSGIVEGHSQMMLYTPVFDLTELQKPVLEFDLLNSFYNDSFPLWPYDMGNMMYSVDGGESWKTFKQTNKSFKRMYHGFKYDFISGLDYYPTNGTDTYYGELLYGRYQPIFKSSTDYQGRDYDEVTHFVVDLDSLKNSKQIQFMYVYSNSNYSVEGILLDNFEIREAEIDLDVIHSHKLLAAHGDAYIRYYMKVKNNENYISDTTSINYYMSVDSILDSGDSLLTSKQLFDIMPYANQFINLRVTSPANYSNYNYIIYEIDPNNIINESNEQNNVGYIELAMDTAAQYSYPLLYDFNEYDIDGWTWYHDSSGFRDGQRFRHNTVVFDPVQQVTDGMWFLDLEDGGYNGQYYWYPIHYLETPTYDFSHVSEASMSFDFICIGVNNYSNSKGANMEYSTDGGTTWQLLTQALDPNAQNWYNFPSIVTLNNEPGWGFLPTWQTASFNTSFLLGQESVKFRYKVRTVWTSNTYQIQGFRMDNFQLDAIGRDLESYNMPTINADIAQPTITTQYKISNNGTVDCNQSITNFYWSLDTILDTNDLFLNQFTENAILVGDTATITRTFTYPTPVDSLVYYLIYFTDGIENIIEYNENNNVSFIKVLFNDSSYIDLTPIPTDSVIHGNPTIYNIAYSYYFENKGTYHSPASTTSLYWSNDTILDAGDYYYYSNSEPAISAFDSALVSGIVYFPLPLTQNTYYLIFNADSGNVIYEHNETNNKQIIKVVFDSLNANINSLQNSLLNVTERKKDFVISIPESVTGPISFVFYNSLGQSIQSINKIATGRSTIIIDKPEITKGIYILSVRHNNTIYSYKFYNQ